MPTKVSEVFSPEYLATLSKLQDLNGATFWWCSGCKKPIIIFGKVSSKRCGDFSHRRMYMKRLVNDLVEE